MLILKSRTSGLESPAPLPIVEDDRVRDQRWVQADPDAIAHELEDFRIQRRLAAFDVDLRIPVDLHQRPADFLGLLDRHERVFRVVLVRTRSMK